jgi:hypothetical protein
MKHDFILYIYALWLTHVLGGGSLALGLDRIVRILAKAHTGLQTDFAGAQHCLID